jgi:soluble lytic murein transglycosylase-like protein
METKHFIILAVLVLVVYLAYQYSRIRPEVKEYYLPAKFYSLKYGVPYEIILAVITIESSGNPEAVGRDNEFGLMQVRQIAIDDLVMNGFNVHDEKTFDTWKNIHQGTAFLKLQINRMRGNVFDGLRAYNAGQTGANRNPANGLYYANKVKGVAEEYGF